MVMAEYLLHRSCRRSPQSPFLPKGIPESICLLGGFVSDDSHCPSPAAELEPAHPAWTKVEELERKKLRISTLMS